MPEVGLQTAWLATLSVFTILMAVAVLALTRELGVLLIRLGPDKPMVNHEGVDIGTRFPTITLRNIKGTEVEIGARSSEKFCSCFYHPTA